MNADQLALNKNHAPSGKKQGVKLRGADKTARIPIKIIPVSPGEMLRKPKWIRTEFQGKPQVQRLKAVLRERNLHTVCEEASCPNLSECFSRGTATFMIMGDICTRRCPFCDVGHGRPNPLDAEEPINLARTIRAMRLKYVVVTSVDRDDLKDGGAAHFVSCIKEIRKLNPGIMVEILTPDFRGRVDLALDVLRQSPPDIFNHNLETVPRLYRQVRPGADYQHSLALLKKFGVDHESVPTKSGLMLGLGEKEDEVLEVMRDLRTNGVTMLTLGQYLQPGINYLPVSRYVTPEEFHRYYLVGLEMGFTHVASAPLVRSSYQADLQATESLTK